MSELSRPSFAEVMPEVRDRSQLMILDFRELDESIPDYQNIQRFFAQSLIHGINPRLPENRQAFNNEFLDRTGSRYLVGRYAEDRIEMLRGSQIAAEGRTIHMGVDLFSRDLEPVHAPLEGTVVTATREEGSHTFGYYVILRHIIMNEALYSLYGHLSSELPPVGSHIATGEQFARLGDYHNDENGGWSRHLHFQLLSEPHEGEGAPNGYSTHANFPIYSQRFPDPNFMLR